MLAMTMQNCIMDALNGIRYTLYGFRYTLYDIRRLARLARDVTISIYIT